MQTRIVLSLSDAKHVADAARAKAQEHQWNVVIAIADEAGHLIYLERMDGALLGSVLVAQEKARTAIHFRRPTKAIETAISGGRTVMLRLPGATPIEGGLPLIYRDTYVGAIGISGVQSFEDGLIAQAGVEALATLMP